ncbi:MAG: response regulator [Polyangiales bacterium]
MTEINRSMRVREVRVLVIDDDELARAFLVELLIAEGFTVRHTASTIGVTNQLIKDRIDVVVLDVMMPAIRGDRLAALLRKNNQLRGLGVVLVSSHPPEELAALASEVDAAAVVGKREAREELAAAVLKAVRGARRPSMP